MNWIKANKFLSVFFAIMLVGVGALGYLLFVARSHYSDVRTQYEEQSTELNRLLSSAPYPEPGNVQKMEAQKKAHQEAITALRKSLVANEIPLEPLSEVQFQDKLRESVTRVTAKAAERGVDIAEKEKFYMGFGVYEDAAAPPGSGCTAGAATEGDRVRHHAVDREQGRLHRQARRPPLPEESDRKPARRGRIHEARARGGAGREKTETALVTGTAIRSSFHVRATLFPNDLEPDRGRQNAVLYSRACCQVENSSRRKPPSRTEVAVAAPTPPTPPTPPPTAPTPSSSAPRARHCWGAWCTGCANRDGPGCSAPRPTTPGG
jgi:hypothetical protein